MKKALDTQVGGNHYKGFKIQPVVFCELNELSSIQSSIIRYICRYNKSGGEGLQDLRKIQHYVDLLIEIRNIKK